MFVATLEIKPGILFEGTPFDPLRQNPGVSTLAEPEGR